MLNIISKNQRTIFYNQKKKIELYKRFLIIFFLIIMLATYFIYNHYLFILRIPDSSMTPSMMTRDIGVFRPIKIKDEKEFSELVARGTILAIKKPNLPEESIFKKIFDLPVYLLSLGWVKLSHKQVLVRRLLAYPGDRVSIRNKVIYINNRIMLPEWIIKYQDVEIFPSSVSTRDNLEVGYIDSQRIFVLNDNWDQGNDSRLFGTIPIEDVEGVLWFDFSQTDYQ